MADGQTTTMTGAATFFEGRAGRYVLRALELLLLVVIGWLIARMILTLITPLPLPTAPPPLAMSGSGGIEARDYTMLARFDPFGGGAGDAVPVADFIEAAETTLNITLLGVAAQEGGEGSAVMRLSGRAEETFTVGDTLQAGVTLDRIEADRVIISRGGVLESVYLENREVSERRRAGAPATAEAPVNPLSVPSNAPATGRPQTSVPDPVADLIASQTEAIAPGMDISQFMGLQPVRDGTGQIVGYRLFPRDQALFDALGLVEGDIVKGVNGRPVPRSSERIIEMVQELQDVSTITLDLERGGSPVTVTLDLTGF